MASRRRPPLSFPELEPKGRGAILRSSEEVQAEQEMLESQNTGMPVNQQDGMTATQYASEPVNQQDSQQVHRSDDRRAGFTKATYRLSPEALEAIDDAKRLLRRRYQVKASLEEIAEEAILAAYRDLVDNDLSSMLVNKFAGTPANHKVSNR